MLSQASQQTSSVVVCDLMQGVHLDSVSMLRRQQAFDALSLQEGVLQQWPGVLTKSTAHLLVALPVDISVLTAVPDLLRRITGNSGFKSAHQSEALALSMVSPFREAPRPLVAVLPTGGMRIPSHMLC